MSLAVMRNGLGIVTITSLVLLFSSSVSYAWRGNPNIKGPYCTQERQQAVHHAIEEGNYPEWRTLMENSPGQKRVLAVVNKDNFAEFAKAYKLAKEGNFDEADKIRYQLGLPPVYRGGEPNPGYGRGRRWNSGRGMGYRGRRYSCPY